METKISCQTASLSLHANFQKKLVRNRNGNKKAVFILLISNVQTRIYNNRCRILNRNCFNPELMNIKKHSAGIQTKISCKD